MEVGAHVWLRSPSSQWGWVPARIVDRAETTQGNGGDGGKASKAMVTLTLRDDTRPATPTDGAPHHGPAGDPMMSTPCHDVHRRTLQRESYGNDLNYFANVRPFERTLLVDPAALANVDHPDVKLRNFPTSFRLPGGDPEAAVAASPSARSSPLVVGGVHDLIHLTHLHEPAILHALRLRYDADIICEWPGAREARWIPRSPGDSFCRGRDSLSPPHLPAPPSPTSLFVQTPPRAPS